MIKSIKDVNVDDIIWGELVADKFVGDEGWITLVLMGRSRDLYKITFPRHATVVVDDCMVGLGLPLVWHKASEKSPPQNGRYVVFSEKGRFPVVAQADFCRAPEDVFWSYMEGGTQKNCTDNVYWWAEVPMPPMEEDENVNDI